MSITTKIGERIKELRSRLGISQEALAFLADLDRNYVNSVENGKRNFVNLEGLMKVDFYLVTVVHCHKGFARDVAKLIFEETCIFEKMAGIGDSVHIFTDSNFEMFEKDKTSILKYYSE